MHPLGYSSIRWFLGGLSVFSLHLAHNLDFISIGVLNLSFLHVAVAFVLSRLHTRNDVHTQIVYRGYLLGYVVGLGSTISLFGSEVYSPFGVYLVVLSLFHWTEFIITAEINPVELKPDSDLLNHSVEYWVAAVCSWIEFFTEAYFWPGAQRVRWPMGAGVLLCIAGEMLRKGAMLTADSSFTHLVRERKVPGHRLVSSGPYAFCRHPSYAGWGMWAVGTQILLGNPVCAIVYAAASWNFFARRIPYEEATLLQFFGDEYSAYQAKVPFTGIPFVKGLRREHLQ